MRRRNRCASSPIHRRPPALIRGLIRVRQAMQLRLRFLPNHPLWRAPARKRLRSSLLGVPPYVQDPPLARQPPAARPGALARRGREAVRQRRPPEEVAGRTARRSPSPSPAFGVASKEVHPPAARREVVAQDVLGAAAHSHPEVAVALAGSAVDLHLLVARAAPPEPHGYGAASRVRTQLDQELAQGATSSGVRMKRTAKLPPSCRSRHTTPALRKATISRSAVSASSVAARRPR